MPGLLTKLQAGRRQARAPQARANFRRLIRRPLARGARRRRAAPAWGAAGLIKSAPARTARRLVYLPLRAWLWRARKCLRASALARQNFAPSQAGAPPFEFSAVAPKSRALRGACIPISWPRLADYTNTKFALPPPAYKGRDFLLPPPPPPPLILAYVFWGAAGWAPGQQRAPNAQALGPIWPAGVAVRAH